MTRIGIIGGIICLLAACGGGMGGTEDAVADTPEKAASAVEKLYREGKAALQDDEFEEAIEKFDTIERDYPYSPVATKALILSAYAHYKDKDYDSAIAGYQQFVRYYPAHKETPYAYYMIALSYYDQITDVGRDQEVTEKARNALRDVLARYPESEYAHDAKGRLDLVYDHLAGKEMEIGRYYLKRGNYIAAINRFKAVIQEYETTNHAPEALHRLVETYLAMGLRPEAHKHAAVLGHNFRSSQWYQYTYRLMQDDTLPTADKGDGAWWKVF